MPQDRQPLTNAQLRNLFVEDNDQPPEQVEWAETQLTRDERSRLAEVRAEQDVAQIDQIIESVHNLGLGAVRGAGKAVGRMATEAGEFVAPALRMIPGVDQFVATPEEFDQAKELLSPPEASVMSGAESTGERGGFNIANILALLAPGGTINRARTAATRAAGPLMGARASRIAAPAAVEAGVGAGQAMLQGGDPVGTAALSGAMPLAARALRPTGRKLRDWARLDIEQSLRPSGAADKAAVRKISTPFLERTRRGEIPPRISQGGLEDLATRQADAANRAVAEFSDDVLSGRPVLKTKDAILGTLDDQIGRLRVVNRATGQTVDAIDTQQLRKLQAVRGLVDSLGETVDQVALRQVRQQLDEMASRAGGFVGSDKLNARVLESGANAIRRVLNEHNPDLAKLNREAFFWMNLRDVLQRRSQQKVGQQGVVFSAGLASLGGGAVGYGLGSGASGLAAGGGFFLGAEVGRRLALAMRSPLWQRVLSSKKDGLARAILTGNRNKVDRALSRIVSVEFPKIAKGGSSRD